MRQILLTSKEPQKRPALQSVVFANRPPQHRIPSLQGIQHRPLRDWGSHVKGDLSPNVRQVPKMIRKHNPNATQAFIRSCVAPDAFVRGGARSAKWVTNASAPTQSFHPSVCTSTDSTAGRSRTIGAHESPASFEQYTCPPVVPK